jgi:hypothetical protein
MKQLMIMLLTIAWGAGMALAQTPHPSKVNLTFNHWYDYDEMTDALKKLTRAYPNLLTLESIGKSVADRDIWLVTLNDPKTGPADSKTAMYIEGNIHGNELQATETVLYTIWYLTKSYGKNQRLTKLMQERSFYFVPSSNPDGRSYWFDEASDPNSLRGGIRPTDNDHDGQYDEDGPDDLDGDGHITSMWVRDPLGRYTLDEADPRFFTRVESDDPPGGWSRLGQEGTDEDGDGSINEDGRGGYDPNRNFPSDWQPEYIQRGATDYPLSLPECRATAEFIMAHTNIAGVQSYHNSGGMVLYGPGASYQSYPGNDMRVMERMAQKGSDLIPFYDALLSWRDLYSTHGDETSFTYEQEGIMSFVNELWSEKKMFADANRTGSEDTRMFRDMLQFEEVYVPYHEVEHPKYGTVLVGGTTKDANRVAPLWAQEEECHRNFAFTMYHADEMPMVEWGTLQVRKGPADLWEITAEIKNPKVIPTILGWARQHRIGLPDELHCETGANSRVVASGSIRSLQPWSNPTLAEDDHHPERIRNERGVGSEDEVMYQFLVQGDEPVTLRYISTKGGTIEQVVPMEATPEHDAAPGPNEHEGT